MNQSMTVPVQDILDHGKKIGDLSQFAHITCDLDWKVVTSGSALLALERGQLADQAMTSRLLRERRSRARLARQKEDESENIRGSRE